MRVLSCGRAIATSSMPMSISPAVYLAWQKGLAWMPIIIGLLVTVVLPPLLGGAYLVAYAPISEGPDYRHHQHGNDGAGHVS